MTGVAHRLEAVGILLGLVREKRLTPVEQMRPRLVDLVLDLDERTARAKKRGADIRLMRLGLLEHADHPREALHGLAHRPDLGSVVLLGATAGDPLFALSDLIVLAHPTREHCLHRRFARAVHAKQVVDRHSRSRALVLEAKHPFDQSLEAGLSLGELFVGFARLFEPFHDPLLALFHHDGLDERHHALLESFERHRGREATDGRSSCARRLSLIHI